MVPAPAIDPTVSVTSTLYVAPEATVIALESLSEPDTFKEPAEIVVAPVYVLAPDSVRTPAPVFVSVTPEPLIPPVIEAAPTEDVNRDDVLVGAPVTSMLAEELKLRSPPKEEFLVDKLN